MPPVFTPKRRCHVADTPCASCFVEFPTKSLVFSNKLHILIPRILVKLYAWISLQSCQPALGRIVNESNSWWGSADSLCGLLASGGWSLVHTHTRVPILFNRLAGQFKRRSYFGLASRQAFLGMTSGTGQLLENVVEVIMDGDEWEGEEREKRRLPSTGISGGCSQGRKTVVGEYRGGRIEVEDTRVFGIFDVRSTLSTERLAKESRKEKIQILKS